MNFHDNHDKNGRTYAKLDDLKPGDWVEIDAGFDCMEAGRKEVLRDTLGGLALPCARGRHGLDGQLNDDGFLVGVYGPIDPNS